MAQTPRWIAGKRPSLVAVWLASWCINVSRSALPSGKQGRMSGPALP